MIDLYAIRNQEGKWFRRKGYGGYGETWVDDVKKARVYTRIGPARGVVSFFVNKWPMYGTPELVKFIVSGVEVIDEVARIESQKRKKAHAQATREVRKRQREMLSAEVDYKRAAAKLAALHARGAVAT